MAPITQELVDGLKDTITKLETRVAELENRLANDSESFKSRTKSQNMRIILMGPPGAGLSYRSEERRVGKECA